MSGEPQSGTQRWRLAGCWGATLPHLFVGGDLRSAATIDEYTHRHQGAAAGQPATGENIAEVAGEGEDGVYRERETVGEGSYLKSINTLWAHGLST